MALSIKASVRQTAGKNANRRTRKVEKVPGNLVMPETNESLMLELDLADVRTIVKKRSLHVELEIDGVGSRKAVVKEIAWNSLTDEILHVDFMHAQEGKPIRAEIPITFKGSGEVTVKGGILTISIDRLPVQAVPEVIPENILVDVAILPLGSFVAVRDLQLPEGVKVLARPDLRICQTKAARKSKDDEAKQEAEAAGKDAKASAK
ncbi:MAG: 50S ribosomal protein L25 [Planctomycetota bacterium]